MMSRPLRCLSLSNLFPNPGSPRHGIFTQHRLSAMNELEEVDVRVVVPTPSLPFKRHYAAGLHDTHKIPARETIAGVPAYYPRFRYIPKIPALTPGLIVRRLLPLLHSIHAEWPFDVIDAYYLYPDGVAAARLAAEFELPLVLTAYGNDVSLIPQSPTMRARIVDACAQAAAITTVCQALKDGLVEMYVPAAKISPVLHGVDLDLFQPPADLQAVRSRLNLTRRHLMSVGHLIERKGHHFAIDAIAELPDFDLYIAGTGPMEQELKQRAAQANLQDRVHFLGEVPQKELRDWVGTADALALMSSREGIANVIMEALACGTPVLATNVWGAPEIIRDPAAGVLIERRDGAALAEGVRKLMADPPNRTATRAWIEPYTWSATARAHAAILHEAVSPHPSKSAS